MKEAGHHWLRQLGPSLPSGCGRCPQNGRYFTRSPRLTCLIKSSIISMHASLAVATDTSYGIFGVPRHMVDRFRRVIKEQQRNHLAEGITSARIGTQFEL
ncbi:hypothetical protein GCM10010425_46520 [Streptomyces spororaveus]|uniref:Uncharacterized protein n=1 Tax=Streptomyces spororaveus TaxID=284039 RepID=A0ABQ3TAJ6_9ACTN|nr:hypothetical protein Sspor_29940 [Streptomyces spororaveus]